MQCPDKGVLQAYLDDEVSPEEKNQITKHINDCAQCQQTLEQLTDLELWAGEKLVQYQQNIEHIISHAANDSGNVGDNKMIKGGFFMKRSFKKWAAAAASAAVLAGALTIAPVQDAVADFLSVFRVQKVQMVKIDPNELQEMVRAVEEQVGEVDLRQFGKINFEKSVEPKTLSLAEAKAGLPFELKQPATVPAGWVLDEQTVLFMPEGKAEFELNVEQVNAMLKSLGAETMLPETLQGKSFTIKTPAGVNMCYVSQNGEKAFYVRQYASPELNVPQGVDANALRLALLDIPFIPQDLRTQLAAVKD